MAIKMLKEGRYLIDWRDSNNRRYRRTVQGTKKYAQLVEAKLKKEREDAIYFPERCAMDVTFGQLSDSYWQMHGAQCPGRSARHMWQLAKKRFGSIKMKDLNSRELQAFYNEKLKELRPATCNRYFAVVAAIINHAIRHGLWNGTNPCLSVNKKPEDNVREVYWKKEELQAMLKGCRQDIADIILCAYYTGMRRGEIFNMQWENVDLEKGFISILKSKTSRKRTIPIVPQLKSILERIGPKTNGAVFSLSVDAFDCAFKRLKKIKNLTHLHFHDLRHTFASRFRMNQGNLGDLQALLGHSTLRMTNRYAHLSPEYLKKMTVYME